MPHVSERLIIVCLLIAVAALSLQTCFRKEKQVNDLTQVIKVKQDTITRWRDVAGQEHAQKQLAEADINSIKAVYQLEIDSISKLLQVKESQVQAFTGISTKGSGSIVPKIDTVYLSDSSREYSFGYNDKWLQLDGHIGRLPRINYTVFDSLGITVYNKRANWFAASHTYIDVYSLNPNVRVIGLTGFRVNMPRGGHFGIGPYIGYGYNGSRWGPSAGVSFHYSVIRF